MGTWGTKLYEDDLAEDIKYQYEELIKEGKKSKEVVDDMYTIYKEEMEDTDEKTVFWIVLADILCRNKNLTDFVKEKALKGIDENLKIWKKEANKEDYEERKKELERLRKRLENYKREEKNNSIKGKETVEWEIGDTYAYKIEKGQYKGQYLILRKVKNSTYSNNTRYQSAIIYVQITVDKKMPQSREELENLEYIILCNYGNVRHEYKMHLYQIPRKTSEKLTYLGNFINVKTPKDEYTEKVDINLREYPVKMIENLIEKMITLGTNKRPIYYKVDPRDIEDSHVRFLMMVRYYEEQLGIIPPENAIVKDDALLYIALVDSLMIGGIVINPVNMRVKDMQNEAYKRIEELKKIVNKQEETQDKKKQRINILEDLKRKIEIFVKDK